MKLAKVLSNIYKEGGIILIDSSGQKYICGSPQQNNPIILKLMKKTNEYSHSGKYSQFNSCSILRWTIFMIEI